MGVRTLNVSDELSAERGRPVLGLLYSGAPGETDEVGKLLGAAPQSDLVLLHESAHVGRGWLGRMRAAALCDTTVVSASALSNGGGALAVIARTRVGDTHQMEPQEAAEAVAAVASCAYPRIVCPQGPCVYVRREALDLLGGFDQEFAGVSQALSEFGARALERGMLHVAADDVYVTVVASEGGQTAGLVGSAPEGWGEMDLGEEHGVLRRCLDAAEVALHGLSVTIDARALGPSLAGTQVYTIELVLALARRGDMSVRVIVPPDLSSEAAAAFATVPSLELVGYEEAARGELTPSHIVHRPQQVFSEDDLALLRMLGKRIVIGQQDLIAYRSPSYHSDPQTWKQYRRVTRLALAVADRAVFFSGHAARDAIGEDLIEEARTVAPGIGGDEIWARGALAPEEPAGVRLDGPFLLCLGSDYGHKNRPFAIALLAALREAGDWSGRLVFAGGHVTHGSSATDEREELAANPELAGLVIDLGPVSEAVRAWLMGRARAVLYPSLYEGFGLLPFEAARAGMPCLFAPQASLGEGALASAATLIPWDAGASARAITPLLLDGDLRTRHVEALREAAGARRWAEVAEDLYRTYVEAVGSPHRASAPRVWREYERERSISELNQQLRGLRDSVGVLAGPEQGGLLSGSQTHGLVRVAARPLLRRVVLGPIGLLGRRW